MSDMKDMARLLHGGGQIMGDHDDGDPVLPVQIPDQGIHLGRDEGIQPRDRLIEHQQLSGGQQQRVLLARALCAAGKLLVLDEPVAGLDPLVTAEMYSLIRNLNRKDGITVIMVSHDLA
ncbi:MAG: ATP-binding cassette domain-containing protein, partial [Clostridia bacterium]|nr:ATP-binding cassette domain-containing protein [Clostridia bacterium]